MPYSSAAMLRRLAVIGCVLASAVGAAERIVLLDDLPRDLGSFEVCADGSRLYFPQGKDVFVFDAEGKLIDKYGAPTAAREFLPLPNGWFVACLSHANGQLALYRPDGTFAQTLVGRGDATKLRGDMTGWTSPCGAAVDAPRGRLFALDTTMAPRDDRNLPDPDWSRIAVFDMDGKFVGQINAFSAYPGATGAGSPSHSADDPRRTWYEDIEVDPQRQRVYVTSRRTRELLAFNYDGSNPATVPSPGGPIGVFPDGRIAIGAGSQVRLYDPALKEVGALTIECDGRKFDVADLECDGAGRLYASVRAPEVTFLRWTADLKSVAAFGPRYRKIVVELPGNLVTAGDALAVKVQREGRPAPAADEGTWQVWRRPSDGSDLRWKEVAAAFAPDATGSGVVSGIGSSQMAESSTGNDSRPLRGVLTLSIPNDLRGPHEFVVRFGRGALPRADRTHELFVQSTLLVAPRDSVGSVAAFTANGRRAFQQGESIPLHVVVRRAAPANPPDQPVELTLLRRGQVLSTAKLNAAEAAACEIPSEVTCRLTPGEYVVRPHIAGLTGYDLPIAIATFTADLPPQRILYHEFDNQAATMQQPDLVDMPERLDYIRRHTAEVARLGFTRETDRLAGKLDPQHGPQAWRRDTGPAANSDPRLPPAEYFALPSGHGNWEAEMYLDEAVRHGLDYDTQLLGHCDGVRFRDYHLNRLVPVLQRSAQWLGRFPSFYGFNYNDEMFFGGWAQGWTKDDADWLDRAQREKSADRPRADVLRHALRTMYDQFGDAVQEVMGRYVFLSTTTTPMWQYPAVEGSYAPEIYHGMFESYSHFLSEGYQYPWYPAHSVEFLRRPQLRLMGVFDNGYGTDGGDLYVKNLMQVLARGVQGAGVQHTKPFQDPWGATAFRTANELAKRYGSIFAHASPLNEAAVLYSYRQDITEKRNSIGTPHFERVFELLAAGLMAGVPMRIVYEEDVADGELLPHGLKPGAPLLFLVGQTERLPEDCQNKIREFVARGGKVFGDAATQIDLGQQRLPLDTHRLKQLYHEGYAADSIHPLFQPVLEQSARELRAAVEKHLRFPLWTDDLWISKNAFDGGEIRYVMLATETGPLPWDAGAVWSLGAMYCKQKHTYLPKRTTLTLPASGGVVYDVFEQRPIMPRCDGNKWQLDADLRTFPGRLYAIVPGPLGPPRLQARTLHGGIFGETIHVTVELRTTTGQKLDAHVPLHVRLRKGPEVLTEFYCGAETGKTVQQGLPAPSVPGPYTLSVTELLSGQTSSCEVAAAPLPAPLIRPRGRVDREREDLVDDLLEKAKNTGLTLAVRKDVLTEEDRKLLCREVGIQLRTDAELPKEPQPGLYLAAGYMQGFEQQGELLRQAWSKGLYRQAVSEAVPGPGRGLVTAIFAPRGRNEHCIALLGGDPAGLREAVREFVKMVRKEQVRTEPARGLADGPWTDGKPAESDFWRLQDHVGVPLADVAVSGDGKRLAVTADGYWQNLLLVEEQGDKAVAAASLRVGQSPNAGRPWISRDGSLFGVANRTVERYGEAFFMAEWAGGAPGASENGGTTALRGRRGGDFEESRRPRRAVVHDGTSEPKHVFPAFGDVGRAQHQFGVSSDGLTVIAPGSCGVVCWRRDGDKWREAWALDYWREFAKLDWPVSAEEERQPQFHAVIPDGADYALILFGEFTNNGWITPQHPCAAWLAAVNLADGKERWRFAVPVPKTLLFPKLYTNRRGSQVLLHVQLGSWNQETHRFFLLRDQSSHHAPRDGIRHAERDGYIASWNTGTGLAPTAVGIDDETGRIAIAYQRRLLEVRDADGLLRFTMLWPNQPISLGVGRGGENVYLADDGERLSCLRPDGTPQWQVEPGSVCRLTVHGSRVYAAGWDGRLRAFDDTGKMRWTLNCTEHLVGQASSLPSRLEACSTWQAQRAPTTSPDVPTGKNLLADGKAKLTVGGTKGWMSEGTVQVRAEDLTNGKTDDVETPWLHVDELFWDGTAGRQVWAEITFPQPTDVGSITVYENPRHPDSWPTEGLVQIWNERQKRWDTAAFGSFCSGPVNTYRLQLNGVQKLRYVPWNSYYRNFYTSEIEVRGPN